MKQDISVRLPSTQTIHPKKKTSLYFDIFLAPTIMQWLNWLITLNINQLIILTSISGRGKGADTRSTLTQELSLSKLSSGHETTVEETRSMTNL